MPDEVVCWKTLAINPFTFTPEMLTVTARVIACNDSKVSVRPLHPASQISFSGIVEEDIEPEDEEYSWEDILASEWRLAVPGKTPVGR
ncbi:hypothetical protein BJ138DRAFT_171679 [Hygrophoropsis aurantiaca]|uniref:Uncharacterized protein n=1 Tax=Hygrophoropsis aurantiaca TaxID=72124 RepID=A0ACB7ZR44_9AGAM|nr:hypothetical protein BJ138DRAFT_171679 [Hygrophoropsis aurantiaca]